MAQRTISREDLHSLVWAEPMSKVAAEIGVSVTELERLCKKLDVPYPFSGFWRGPTEGQATLRRLPEAKPGTPVSVEITTAVQSRRMLEKPKLEDAERPGDDEPPASSPPKISSEAKIFREEGDKPSADAEPTPPTRLTNPHRILVARMEEERQRRVQWPAMYSGSANKKEALLTRRRRIVENLLFKALEKRGHTIETENRSAYDVRIVIAGQRISYTIRERYTHAREPLSDDERREPWNVLSGRIDRQVRKMTGQLVFTADGSVWPKPTWRDGKRPLEAQISAIVDGLEALAAKGNERETERQLADERYRKEQSRREEIEKRRQREANQWRFIRELAAKAEEAERMRAFIAKMRDQTENAPDNTELIAWLDTIEQKTDRWDPLTGGANAIRLEVAGITHDHYDRRSNMLRTAH
jgi:hypothetical protein